MTFAELRKLNEEISNTKATLARLEENKKTLSASINRSGATIPMLLHEWRSFSYSERIIHEILLVVLEQHQSLIIRSVFAELHKEQKKILTDLTLLETEMARYLDVPAIVTDTIGKES